MLRLGAITALAVAMLGAPQSGLAAEPRPAQSRPAPLRPRGGEGVTIDVKIGDNYFRPKKLELVAGTTVRWTNRGRNEHDVIPNKGTTFGIDELVTGQTYSFQFVEPGRYAYYCSFHGAPGAGQHATIKVVKQRPRRAS